jgi:hypothetical protein
LLSSLESIKVIKSVFGKYNVQKKSGHLSIYEDSLSLPLEQYEFTYSKNLRDEPVFMFFDQENFEKEEVVCINEGRRVGEIMENSYGMEYFLTNSDYTFLLAINWYVLEGAGEAKKWINLAIK